MFSFRFFSGTAIFLDAMICAVTLFLSSLRALELLKVLDDMYVVFVFIMYYSLNNSRHEQQVLRL